MKYNILMLLIFSLAMAACTKTGSNAELVLDSKSPGSQGAIWNQQTGKLYWVNTDSKILDIYYPSLGVHTEMMTGQMIGTVVPSESGKAIVALKNGIYVLDIDTGSKKLIFDPESDNEDNRFNEGKCDPAGRFWAGTMNLNNEPGKGALYRMDGNGNVTKMIGNVSVSGGIAWSNKHDKMYYIDIPTRKVMVYEYDDPTGAISDAKVAVEVPADLGVPDGMTIDADGNLWIALRGGFGVGCWDPDTGKMIRKIDVPARYVTSCAFGDDDLGTLYITTARQDISEEELEKYPHSGGVFKVRPGVKGVPAYFFKGDY